MERDFEQEFRQLKQDEIPDLWNRIEAGLSEKQPSAKKIAWGKWATLAAAIVCCIIAIPAISLTIGRSVSQSDSSMAATEACTEETNTEEYVSEEACATEETSIAQEYVSEEAVTEEVLETEDSMDMAEERQPSLPTKDELFSGEFEYNTFLESYKTDLDYIRFYAYFDESEWIEHEDAFEVTNVCATKYYYLDAEVVDNAHVGDTIIIQGIEYLIQTMEQNTNGYSVSLQVDENTVLPEEQYIYQDIYGFERTNDGKHYVILFCSGDYIEEQIYLGSVFFDKDCIMTGYYHGEVCDVLLSEYYANEEYPYISIMSFKITKEGLIRSFQNQIAG